MIHANITGNTFNIRFMPEENIGMVEFSRNLGDELFKFLAMDISEVYTLYVEMSEAFMEHYYGELGEKSYNKKLAVLNDELDKLCVYLHVYTHEFIRYMTEHQSGLPYSIDEFISGQALDLGDMQCHVAQLLDNKKLKPPFCLDLIDNYQFDVEKISKRFKGTLLSSERTLARELAIEKETHKPISKPSMQKAIGLCALLIAYDIKRKQKLFVGDLDSITGSDKLLEGLTLQQLAFPFHAVPQRA